MKVIDKQLLFINSDERDRGSSADFHLTLPSHLISCLPHQKMRMVLNDVVERQQEHARDRIGHHKH